MSSRLHPAWCEGVIIVHEDRTYTCTQVGCDASESRIVALSRHASFLACRDVLGDDCPICHLVRRYPVGVAANGASGNERAG